MLTASWTSDLRAIESIANAPEVASYILETDSYLTAVEADCIKYLGIYKASTLVGVYILYQRNRFMWEVHTCMTLDCRGKDANFAAQLLLLRAFADLDIACLTTNIPVTFTHVKHYAKRAGLKYIGTIPDSFLSNGALVAVDIFAITKQEAICQLQSLPWLL